MIKSEEQQESALKKSGALKKKYHDVSRFPLVTSPLENESKKLFSDTVKSLGVSIKKLLER